MKKIGTITIGQSPRVDLVPELRTWLAADCEIVERGALDGLSHAEIAAFGPRIPGEDVLVTRLVDGSSVRITHEAVIPRVQRCIQELEEEVSSILLLCTGTFPVLTSRIPVLIPEILLSQFVEGIITQKFVLGVLTPSLDQVSHQQRRWLQHVSSVRVAAANPYADIDAVIAAGVSLGQQGVDAIVLDCMGYTLEMKQRLRAHVNCPVILSRAVLARVADELV